MIEKADMPELVLVFINRATYSDLAPGAKQMIFSFLTLTELVSTINKLRKVERNLLDD